jgi:hypothetical protein
MSSPTIQSREGAKGDSRHHWLLLVAVNLVLAGYFDVAVRDVVMAVSAFVLARGLELRESTPAATRRAA